MTTKDDSGTAVPGTGPNPEDIDFRQSPEESAALALERIDKTLERIADALEARPTLRADTLALIDAAISWDADKSSAHTTHDLSEAVAPFAARQSEKGEGNE